MGLFSGILGGGGIAGSLLGGLGLTGNGGLFGTSQGTVPYNTTQQSSPWAPVQPYLQDLFGRGQALSQQGPSPYTLQAQQMAAQRALNPNSLTGQAEGALGATIRGDYLNPSSNPYLAASVNDALGLAKSQFAGQYGGAGANLSNSGYQEALARTLGNVATNAYSNAYQQERGNQMGALSMAPSLDYARAGALSDVGAQQQAFPWQQLQGFQAALAPGLGFGTSVGQNQMPYFQNNTAQTLGAAAGIAGAAKMFSDRRLKSNIVKLGDDPRGFGIYEYDMFGKRQVGVMADEIERVIPDAVTQGLVYKLVDYARVFQ